MTRPRVPSFVLGVLIASFLSVAEVQAQVDIAATNVSLTINSGTVGVGLTSASNSTTYSVLNFIGSKKLVGKLSTAMPAGTTLQVQLAAPFGATSSGLVTLTSSNQNLVTGIGFTAGAGLSMAFTLSATVSAGVIASASKTFTLTLVDAP